MRDGIGHGAGDEERHEGCGDAVVEPTFDVQHAPDALGTRAVLDDLRAERGVGRRDRSRDRCGGPRIEIREQQHSDRGAEPDRERQADQQESERDTRIATQAREGSRGRRRRTAAAPVSLLRASGGFRCALARRPPTADGWRARVRQHERDRRATLTASSRAEKIPHTTTVAATATISSVSSPCTRRPPVQPAATPPCRSHATPIREPERPTTAMNTRCPEDLVCVRAPSALRHEQRPDWSQHRLVSRTFSLGAPFAWTSRGSGTTIDRSAIPLVP